MLEDLKEGLHSRFVHQYRWWPRQRHRGIACVEWPKFSLSRPQHVDGVNEIATWQLHHSETTIHPHEKRHEYYSVKVEEGSDALIGASFGE